MHTLLEFICPHCLEKNPAFGPQRCEHCKMNMLSDQEQRVREGKVKSLAGQLEEQLMLSRGGKSEQFSSAYAFQLLQQLTEVKESSQVFAYLSPLLEGAREALHPFEPPQRKGNPTLMINIIILILLILAPLMMSMLGADPMVLILLTLPVLGWGYIGIYAYIKKKPQSQRKKENR